MSGLARISSVLLVAAILALPAAAFAEAEGWDTPYVGAMGTYIDPDDDARLTDGDGFGVKFLYGWNWSGHLNLELLADFDNLESNIVGTDFYRSALELDALYYFNPRGWSPFLVGGLGVAYNDVVPNSFDEAGLTANAGLGLLSPPFSKANVRVRGDVRYVYDDWEENPGDVHFNLGLVFPLFQPPREVVRVETKEVVKTVVKEVPIDLDSDDDGVVDSKDKCPNTLPGTEVDGYGCAIEKAVTRLDGVNFEFDSARLTSDSQDILNRAVKAMLGQPTMTVEIAGHTCDIGSEAYNQRLSESRAASVKEYLVGHGVEPERMTAKGYGESDPTVPNTSEENRSRNRRVEFRVKTP